MALEQRATETVTSPGAPATGGHSRQRRRRIPTQRRGAATVGRGPYTNRRPVPGTSVAVIGEWVRCRELAGDGHVGVWSRKQARELQVRFLRRARGWLLTGLALQVLVGVAVFLLEPSAVRGFVSGAFAAGSLGLDVFVVVQFSGSVPLLAGVGAEQLTAAELRRMRAAGWRLVNGFGLGRGDIDHVLIGPAGVYVFETKWQSRPWTLNPPQERIARAAAQASANARSLRLWTATRKAGVGTVTPIVVLWGPTDADQPAAFRDAATGVLVIPGRLLARWHKEILDNAADSDTVLDTARVESYWAALSGHARKRDQHDGPAPATVNRHLARAGVTFAGFTSAVLALTATLALDGTDAAAVAELALLTGLGALMFPVRRLRPYATGWLLGLAAVAALVAGSALH